MKFLVCALALSATLSALGCATVRPYEREFLAKPGMDTTREQARVAFESHVHESREGAAGGFGGAGGGCGCN